MTDLRERLRKTIQDTSSHCTAAEVDIDALVTLIEAEIAAQVAAALTKVKTAVMVHRVNDMTNYHAVLAEIDTLIPNPSALDRRKPDDRS